MINLKRVKPFYQRDDNFFEDLTDLLVPGEGNTNDTSSTVPVVVADHCDQGQTDPPLLAEPEVNPPVQTALESVHVDDGTTDVVPGTPVADPIISVGDLPSVLGPDPVQPDTTPADDIAYPAERILKQKGQGHTMQFRVKWADLNSAPFWVPAANVNEALTKAYYETHKKTSLIRKRQKSAPDLTTENNLLPVG